MLQKTKLSKYLQCCLCSEIVAGCRINLSAEKKRVSGFDIYQSWKVKIRQLKPISVSNVLSHLGSFKDTAWRMSQVISGTIE